ncbi:MAG TPA: hypothetical protein VFD10_05365 [Atribacterota bacterium]|nr:hypothetical protein [Atribacterota bacterium]
MKERRKITTFTERKEGKDGMATLSSKAMIEKLILIIFIYKWRKCVKSVGEYFLESLI